MAELVDKFGGKVSGELIRAADWNGLIAAIEGQLGALGTQFDGRIDALESRIDATEGRIAAVETDLAPLARFAAALRDRYRRLDLSATRTTFAIGERGEIVARVSDLEGAPLDLSNASTRPWIDFVTVWGALRAAPGFASQGGASNRTIAVQVNGSGEARVLLRAEHAEAFAEEQELEVAAVLQTSVGAETVAERLLAANTPGSSGVVEAYAAVSSAYERVDTPVMRNYLDAYYVRNPAQSFSYLNSVFALNWRDYHATVIAFVKPDDAPGTADAAQAVGSIRVTFRDWVYPWIITHYLPPQEPRIADYRNRFGPRINLGFEQAVGGLFEVIRDRTADRGLIGMQRELAAAQEALVTLPAANAPSYFRNLINTVGGGLQVQQRLVYSQAVTPLVSQDIGAGIAVGAAGAQGEIAIGREIAGVREETNRLLGEGETRVIDLMRAENDRFATELLKEDGAIRRAENTALAAREEVNKVNIELNNRAPMELVGKLLTARGGG
jgi:hypothetical protein